MAGLRFPSRRAFSMIELVFVVLIMGVVVAIATPRFSEAAEGRSLSFAKRTIEQDIDTIKLRARATGLDHVIVFYPDQEMYIAFEGTSIERDAVVLIRDLAEDPLGVGLDKTSIGGAEDIVVSTEGELEKDFSLGISSGGTSIQLDFTGTDFTRAGVTQADSEKQVQDAKKAGELGARNLGAASAVRASD